MVLTIEKTQVPWPSVETRGQRERERAFERHEEKRKWKRVKEDTDDVHDEDVGDDGVSSDDTEDVGDDGVNCNDNEDVGDGVNSDDNEDVGDDGVK